MGIRSSKLKRDPKAYSHVAYTNLTAGLVAVHSKVYTETDLEKQNCIYTANSQGRYNISSKMNLK